MYSADLQYSLLHGSVTRARMGIRKAIEQRMLDIANCAAGSVNGNFLSHINQDIVGSDEYNAIYDTLSAPMRSKAHPDGSVLRRFLSRPQG
ncbi:MAG: hypothetical protein K6E62_04405 [Lachnospiraceae bacterium]|nr:hypothetical protein [Lachnospiraceae bacterium]